jgi:hypothetical protein
MAVVRGELDLPSVPSNRPGPDSSRHLVDLIFFYQGRSAIAAVDLNSRDENNEIEETAGFEGVPAPCRA